VSRAIFLILFLIASSVQAAWQVRYQEIPENIRTPLLKAFPDIAKDKISKARMDDIIRWAHAEMGADRVIFTEVAPNMATLTIQKVPRIGEINFYGLSALSESEARPYIAFNINDAYNEQLLLESGERLRQVYKELGYLNAEIDVEMPTNKQGQLVLNIKIRENQRTQISEIVLDLNNEPLKKEIYRRINSFKGNTFTDSTLAEIQTGIRSTLNIEGYYLAEILGPEARFNADETRVELIYKFDKVIYYAIDFKGNRDLFKTTLNDVLDMRNYSSANPNLATELSGKLRAKYLSEGYARVEIQAEETEGRTPQSRNLTFMIDEGSKVKIDDYFVTGKFSRDADYYIDFIKKNSGDLIKDGYYNSDDLDTGLKNLVTHLRNQGHLLAKVISKRTPYNRARDRVSVYINLDEGPVTQVESVEFTGNASVDKETLNKILGLHPDEPLRLNVLEKAIQDIKNYYYDHGFIDMVLANEKEDLVIYNQDNTRAKLNFKILEGPQVKVASILIDGNYFTKDYVILNEIDLSVGSIVTPSKIEESIARLQRVGHFNTVEVKTLEEKTNVAERTLLVRVSERNPGQLTAGLGATNERQLTIRGYTGIAYRNLWGTGRGAFLRLEGNYNVADIKYLENKMTIGYLEPYLFNSRVRGRVNVTRSKTVTDYEQKIGTEVNQATWSIEKDFTSHILGIWDLYSIATVRDFSIDNSSDINTLLNIASTGPTIDFNYLDNYLNPTSGNFTQLSAEYASPGMGSTETIEYLRATATYKHFIKLAPGPWVWANAFKVGVLQNYNHSEGGGVPYSKKGFVLGGRNTLRGYESGTQEVFPNRRDLGIGSTDDYLLTTRAKMGLIKTEIQFPLIGNFSGALFYDGGYVEIEGLRFEDYYRDTVGFGLHYNTPVGPLNLEFGWKLDRREDEETGRFHLSIGTF
jgi:outer membrane protein assembly complex protein YaeT